MKKYLVIGNPIEHSLSPKLHNYWIKKNKINAFYDKKKMNEYKFVKAETKNTVKRESFLKSFVTSLRQKMQTNAKK